MTTQVKEQKKNFIGHGRIPIVTKRWDTIKGVVFLSRRTYREVAFCQRSIRILTKLSVTGASVVEPTDSTGPHRLRRMQGIFRIPTHNVVRRAVVKLGIVDIRATDTSSSHNRLNVLLGVDHLDVRTVIEKLKYIDSEAQCTLQWIRKNPNKKHLKKRGRERRENIEACMKRRNHC
ncbi:hypothetical protein COOONC_13163 [Cooperia oncophora]